jgi:hypothetical protein
MWLITDLGATTAGLAFDPAGNLYASAPSQNKIFKISGLVASSSGTGKNLVALGDSVAAGEGINYGFAWNGSKWVQTGPDNPNWTDATAATGTSEQFCHQTDYAYSRMFAALGYAVYNMACTGASALSNNGLENGGVLDTQFFDGMLNSQLELGGVCADCQYPWSNPNPVFDSHNPDVVTLTLGADDINFSDWVRKCYSPSSPCNTDVNTQTIASELTTQQLDLRTVLRELDRRAGIAGKTVTVVVTNYYNPFTPSYTQCADTDASPLQGNWPLIGISYDEQTWITSQLTTLNQNISNEVSYAWANDAHLAMRLADVSAALAGHQFCTPDPWVYGPSINYPNFPGIQPGTNPAPFHVTPAGQMAIYNIVKAQLP